MLEVKLVRSKINNKPLFMVKQGNRVIFLTEKTFRQLEKKIKELLPEYQQRKLDWFENKQRAEEYFRQVVKDGGDV